MIVGCINNLERSHDRHLIPKTRICSITVLSLVYFAKIIIVIFSFFHLSSFFRHLISEVTERISTKLGHIFTYDYYLKNLVQTPPALTPTGVGQKTLFWTDFEL